MLKTFPDFTVCSGHKGLDKNVSTITVMDAPDIYNWMKGDEFLITSGYPLKDCPEKFADLILKLKAKNITALGIKINRFVKKLPDIVIETSNKVNLPVIHIPDHYAFSDIINPGLTALVHSQYNDLVKSEAIHNEFIKLGIYHTEINNVLERLQKFINKDSLYLNSENNKVYFTSNTSFKDYIMDHGVDNINRDDIYVHHVFDDHRLYGYIIINCSKSELNQLDLRTIEYAQTMIIFHIQKEFSNEQIIKSYQDNFLLDLLLNNIKSDEEINNRAKIYNWHFDTNMFCLIIDIVDYKLNYKSDDYQIDMERTRDLIYEDIIKMMKKINRHSYYLAKSDSIVFIINHKEKDLVDFEKSLFEMCKTIEKKHGYSLTVCIGNRYENIRDINKSYEECLICIKSQQFFKEMNTSIIQYNDISIYWNLLNSLKDNGYENDPVILRLQGLRDFDRLNNTEYYDSIKYIVNSDWNLKEASEKMFIHYNTIKYRYAKIKEFLDDNLDSRTSKLKIELGLYMFEIL